MKLLYNLLKNIKNLIPYLSLITIYFFFVNLEASNNNNNKEVKTKYVNSESKPNKIDNQLKISIPVIPYKK
tara:strand:- start:391 stop:603 length:213 start_codon:yes stop_codon:yes gene_type:complete